MKKKLVTIETVVLTLLMVSSAFLVFSSATATSAQTTTTSTNLLQYEWTCARSTPEGTFASAGPGPTSASILWKAKIPYVGGTMAAFDGMVFTSDLFGTCYAIDASTGNVVWKMTLPPSLMGSSPCKLDDTYMLLGGTCVKIADGSVVWTATNGFAPTGIEFNGAGYVPEIGMYLAGAVGWNLPDPSKSPTLAWNVTSTLDGGASVVGGAVYGGGKLFLGCSDGFLRAYDAKSGTLLWTTPASSGFIYGMTYDNGVVFHGGLDNNMRAWDANTGKLLWTYNPHTWYGEWASSTGAAYGMVYEHNQDTYLYAINETTGRLVWSVKGPGIGYSNILGIAGGKVYCQMGEREYRDFNTGQYATSEYDCYDAYTGALLWSMPVENGAPSNIQCIAYGNLYICPTMSPQIPGVWAYTFNGMGSIGELWCIGSTPKDWSMFGADPTHSNEGAGPTNLTQLWKFNTGAEVISPVTVASGVAYAGSSNGNIYALNANTGVQLWSFKTGFEVRSEVAVVNGKVYTGSDDGNVYCLDASSGNKIWATSAGGITVSTTNSLFPPARSSPEVVNGKVYVGSLDGNLYCLDANSGVALWKFQTGGQIEATPTLDNTGVYLPANTPGETMTLYKLDLNSGSIIWQDSIPYLWELSAFSGVTSGSTDASATLAPDLGMVFLRTMFVENFGINSTTGKIIWVANSTTNAAGTSFQAGGVPQVCAPLYAYGAVYINNYYGISCLNALNGSSVWTTYLSREDFSQGISYSYGRIYVVNELGNLYVLDALSGQKLSYVEFGPQMHSMPTLYAGNVYVGSNDWNVYCFGDTRVVNAQPATATQPTATNQPASNPTATPHSAPTATPQTSAASSTNTTNGSTTTYIVIAAVAVVIVIVAVAAVILTRRKKKT